MCHHRPKLQSVVLRQKGFLMPLALFILVGLAALVMTMTRLTSAQQTSFLLGALSTQAFYAAESGAQYALNQFQFKSNSVPKEVCLTLNKKTFNFSTEGLSSCRASLECMIFTDNPSVAIIRSAGLCGRSTSKSQRELIIRYDIQSRHYLWHEALQ